MAKAKKQSEPVTGQGSSWTQGRQFGATLTTAALIGAILCGPAALVVAFSTSSKPAVATVATDGSSELTVAQQGAGAFAVGYVGAWLSASKENTDQLGEYIDLSAVRDISDLPWEYRDLSVVSNEPTGETAMTVVVAANIKELGVTAGSDETTDVWPRRYFQVVVNLVDGTSRVVGLPAPVAAPLQGEPVALDYATTTPSNSPVAEAVLAFFGAYLADSGELARYITPGAPITAITPAPYVQVTPIDLRTNTEASDTPGDGEQVHMLATVVLANALDQRVTATYSLTLTARADRWEVTSIDLAPHGVASLEATNSSPSTDGTTEGTK